MRELCGRFPDLVLEVAAIPQPSFATPVEIKTYFGIDRGSFRRRGGKLA